MLHYISKPPLLAAIILSIVTACSSGETPSHDHPAVETYYEIRNNLAAHDFAAAAALTTDPDQFSQNWRSYADRQGKAAFSDIMKKQIEETEFHSVREDGNYAVLVIQLSENSPSPVAAEFFTRQGNGQYAQLVTPNGDIPCSLVQHFYKAKGDPGAEVSCRK